MSQTMSEVIPQTVVPIAGPDVSSGDEPDWDRILLAVHDLITEDDEPVDNLFSETQQRLLTEPLYSSWTTVGRPFLAAANVGVFQLMRNPGIVPDVLLSLDVEVPKDFWSKERRSYYIWEYGKAPDIVVEIVSNKEGGEDGHKKDKYARMRVGYYVIFDPLGELMPEMLTIYRWNDFKFERQPSSQFSPLGIGLTLWEGLYEEKHDTWLRWVDANGQLILTGKERADQEHARAEQEHARAEQGEQLLQQERQRTERLAEMLRQLGKNPDEI